MNAGRVPRASSMTARAPWGRRPRARADGRVAHRIAARRTPAARPFAARDVSSCARAAGGPRRGAPRGPAPGDIALGVGAQRRLQAALLLFELRRTGVEGLDERVELLRLGEAPLREAAALERPRAEVAHAAVIGGEGHRTEAVHEDLIDARACGQDVGVEIAIAMSRVEPAVERRLEVDGRLGVGQRRGCRAVDHPVVVDRPGIAPRIGHHDDRTLGESPQVAERDPERLDLLGCAADDEDEALFGAHVGHSRYQSSSTATFQRRQWSAAARRAATAGP